MWLLYQLAFALALVASAPVLLARRGGHYLPTIPGRLGHGSWSAPDRPLWIHAVSVGEVGVAATLVRSLPQDLPLLVTTITPTGQEAARKVFADRAQCAYLPFDLGGPIRRFFDRTNPRACILVEGDYWPLLLSTLARRSIPVAVINGRISDRTHRRLLRLRPIARPFLDSVAWFGMQDDEDRRRLVSLGVDPGRVAATGNLKFDAPPPRANPDLEERLRRLAAGRPIVVAGSTMAGEEEMLVHALGDVDRPALLVLAPRHPERWDTVADLLASTGRPMVRRSRLGDGVEATPDTELVLLDSLGELASLYRIATVAFVGGSLVPTGGHNPLEVAQHGVPLTVGPHQHNFREIAGVFDRHAAWLKVDDPSALATVWGRAAAGDPEIAATAARGQRLLAENRGATARTIAALARWL